MKIYEITEEEFKTKSPEEQKKILKAYGKDIDIRIERSPDKSQKGKSIKEELGIKRFERKGLKGISNEDFFKKMREADPGLRRVKKEVVSNKKGKIASVDVLPSGEVIQTGKALTLKQIKHKENIELSKRLNPGLQKYIEKNYNKKLNLNQTKEIGRIFKLIKEENLLNDFVLSTDIVEAAVDLGEKDLKKYLKGLKTKNGDAAQKIKDFFALPDDIKYEEVHPEKKKTKAELKDSILGR